MSEFGIIIEEAQFGVNKGFKVKYWYGITCNFGRILFTYIIRFKRGYHDYIPISTLRW